MRRNRRGGGHGLEFGGSGEDSFVAVVVTKLTGALLFILVLTMVIMALLPKAVDSMPSGSRRDGAAEVDRQPLAIVTPEALPEAIAGRPYAVALAAAGGGGTLKWSIDGDLPEGLSFDAASGVLKGTPKRGTPQPLALSIRVTDGDEVATQATRLLVYQSDRPLSTPAWWKPGLPPVLWRQWLDHGVGFLLLWLIYLVGMNALAGMERGRGEGQVSLEPGGTLLVTRRFSAYRIVMRLATLSATAGLAAWLWIAR
ncbi:Putative Ig domain protein [Aquisphaera giovannonii]|uniref:Ig domain protein n=1 Tax=Aquisphaera giovannonii TaxID=406548 RepID=A0A5B9W095_9BACT|nr:Ig domain-containing protein [Aquisphaera giovannonii]QEH33677.1 Putative Ig domain protein [Aquisphaera giovannonii]